jgi:hypothetical protein
MEGMIVTPSTRAVVAELQRLGVPYELRRGKKHDHVVVRGRTVAVLSRGRVRDAGKAMTNVIAAIRRAAREVQE